MKKFLLIAFLSLITSAIFSQTLFTYGSQAVSKQEFLRAYNKNNTGATNKNSALRDYLDLYIKFKLKVKAALDQHLDTLSNINTDLQNFRSQIEEGYLTDEKQVNILITEAFNRSQKDIHVIHLFIPFDKSTFDTLKLHKAAQDAYDALIKNVSFEDVTAELKNKSINASWADIGFITVFNIPYEFENIVYQLQPGAISKPYRSVNGYHFFKNIEERKAAGKIKVAQILIAVPPGADNIQRDKAKKIADSVYKNLRQGASFSDMAKAVSNDRNTYMSGGVMPEFSVGKYDPVFESKAFALQKDSDVSVPFQTSFGYHILKRLGQTPVPSDKNNTEYLAALKLLVQQDSRVLSAKEKFLKDVLKTLGYKKNAAVNENNLWSITDSFITANKQIITTNLNQKTLLFSFNSKNITVADWLKFAKNYKNNQALYKGESNQEIMQKFVSTTALDIYRENLENYNADFKYQLQEFKDGNMLFEIMERNVWSKASADSAGLLKYFNQNKTKYFWKKSADVILVSCANEKIANSAAQQLRSGKDWHLLSEDNASQIQTDSGRYELTQIPVKSNVNLIPDVITDPLVNEADGTASFVKVLAVFSADQPRTFEEARGLVINDYQNILEEKWIDQLKKKYPVKIDEKVFKSLMN